jgi:predicted Zn-dependent protease
MSDDPISQFDFDADSVQPILHDALHGADDGELFLETEVSESLVFDDGRLKAANLDSSRGFGLRCVAGDAFGYAHSSDPTLDAVRRAPVSRPRPPCCRKLMPTAAPRTPAWSRSPPRLPVPNARSRSCALAAT